MLEYYRLAERRNGRWSVTLAGILLFAKDPSRWHPRCGIDFAIWQGTERKTGAQFNIKKRLRLEGLPLPRLIPKAYETIEEYLPERQTLVELFFEERLTYPTFAWQEALVNAVAHRDYRHRGLGIEIDLFDDRLEVRSPGELIEPVTLERLRRRERVHASRNPRIVRVLTDFGFMRERGEGIPRMFETMESEGLKPPDLAVEGGCFVVILRSTPIYSLETMRWLKQFEEHHLTRNQLRLLAFAKEHQGRFTSRVYQKFTGIDPYTATQDIRTLVRKGIVRTVRPRGRVYMIVEPSIGFVPPEEIKPLLPLLQQKECITNADVRRHLGLSRIQAYRFLNQLVRRGLLEQHGKGRGVCYRLPPEMHHSWHE